MPASFAIGAGQTTELLGVRQSQPASASTFRYNFGFVEVTGGGTCTVKVTMSDATGAAQGSKTYTVHEWEQVQKSCKDEFGSVATENSRLTVEVTSGSGKVIAFRSGVANGSQDPSTFEMAFRDELLAENATGSISGVTAGSGLTGGGTAGAVTLNVGAGAGIAVSADAVSAGRRRRSRQWEAGRWCGDGAKVSTTGGSNGQVLTVTTSGAAWQAVPSGSGGDITAVTAGSGLSGGGTTGDVTLSIPKAGVTGAMLVADSVTTDKIADGTIASADLGFNYAGSGSKGGPASDLACTSCVVAAEVSGSGASNGQVLTWTTAAR